MKEVIESAYAKINWYLAVGGRRSDGYHDILSIMQTVSLADTVTIRPGRETGICIRCHGEVPVPSGEENLAWRAAERYYSRAGMKPAVTIELHKRIPTGSGLAGGSADAAAVLRGLNAAFDQKMSHEALLGIAAEIGSDVPFCLYGGVAVVQGRGERLTAVAPTPKRYLVLVNAGEHVSTAEAYARLDKSTRVDPIGNCDELLEVLHRDDIPLREDLLRNDFAPLVLPLCPGATDALRILRELGGVAQMSGSGSTVYAVFSDEDTARYAASKFTGNVFCVTTL